jgi:nucleotide-binding universal stress UspA family protein
VIKKPVRALTRIIVGTDGSNESKDSVEFLRQLPLLKPMHVTVLAAVPPLPFLGEKPTRTASSITEKLRAALEADGRKLVSRVARDLRRAGLDANGVVTRGLPALEIMKLAETDRADLIVVGAHGRRSAREYLMGSVSDSVVKYAPCSVLVYRRPHEFWRGG